MQSKDTENIFYVEKILKKQTAPTLKYLVKWKGYDISHATWEPEENLKNAAHLIDEFEAREKILFTNKKRTRDSNENVPSQNKSFSDESDQDNKNEEEKTQERDYMKRKKRIFNNIPDNIKDNIESGCEPNQITGVKKIKEQLYCQVKFEERSDGLVPDECYIPSSVLADLCPKLLIDFYESRLKFI